MKETGSADLLRLLQEQPEDEVPVGFLTAEEWGKEWKKSGARTRALLKTGIERGIIEVQSFRRRRGERNLPIPHYKWISHS